MIYGYELGDVDSKPLMELREVTFSLRPDELRKLAQFLLTSADAMETEKLGSPGWHKHASDAVEEWREFAPGRDVIVSLDAQTASKLSWDDVPRVKSDDE